MNKLSRPVQRLGDLTLIGTNDRHVRLTYPPALPKWEVGWSVDGCGDFLKQ
jgi:hypothetical protein